MKLNVICQDCGKTLCSIEKDQISQEDVDLYSNTVVCDNDKDSKILAVKTLE